MTSNISQQTLRQMQIMVNKLRTDPSYMAWVIDTYQKQERISAYKFIELTNINEEILVKLSLCRRPDTNSVEFVKQIKQISEYTKIDSQFLVNIIRQIESVETISEKLNMTNKEIKGSWQLGLAAARDKTEDDNAESSPDKDGDEDDLAK